MVGMIALVACNNTSSQPNTSKPTETSDSASSEPTESSEPTDSSEATDPYKDRIKSKDFKVINISNEKQSSNDPRFFDEAKPLSTYLKADTYKLYYLDEVNDVYYIPLSTYVDLYKGDFKDGVTNTVVEENGVATWTSKMGTSTYTLSLDKKLP